MSVSVHNPDQYMASLRQILGQGTKRIGLLVGAGGPAGTLDPKSKCPLIPAVAGLTKEVLAALQAKYGVPLKSIEADLGPAANNIEALLSRSRSLSAVIGKTQVHGLDSDGHKDLSKAICAEIGRIVDRPLPPGSTPYTDLVNWITGTDREFAVEIFTTNYDLLFEQALERARAPYFDGFTGAAEPFFDPSTISNNDLPPRWTRLWKLHGSLGWKANTRGEVTRCSDKTATHLVFPEHLKYDQTQKAPYVALFDRLRAFLMTPDTLLLASGFSFADAHVTARVDECLSANPTATLFAFQFGPLEEHACACEVAARRPNMSVYAKDKALINGVVAPWQPGDLPSRDWAPIRATYWGTEKGGTPVFQLGTFDQLARFFVSSRSHQILPPPVTAPPVSPP